MQAYTLAVTSCNRHDLLKQTIESFFNTTEQNPQSIVVIEDGATPMPEWMNRYRHLNLKWLNNQRRMGQAVTVSRLIAALPDNEYTLWGEDDWSFNESGFLRASEDILKKYPEISQVSLRGTDCNGHPLVNDPRYPFRIQEPGWRGGWGGWSFNPSLCRTADLKRIQKYLAPHFGQAGLGCELEISQKHIDAGHRIGTLRDRPHVTHIGNGRSRAIEPVEQRQSKILIAVPACHKLDYGKWESTDSPTFDKSKAWKGEGYGKDIHVSGDNPRIAAVRETWFKDATHKNVTAKFFYGVGATREPLADEVFLGCPDDYEHLPHKTIAIVNYAHQNNYDLLMKCDDDTFVYIDRLVEEANNVFDYAGYLHGAVCTGGPGYWLSRRGMEAVQNNPNCWAEDVWVAKCMKSAGIEPVMLPMHRPGFSDHWFHPKGFDPTKVNDTIVTAHAVQPEVMRQWYQYLQNGTT